jgi:hypothetical protein
MTRRLGRCCCICLSTRRTARIHDDHLRDHRAAAASGGSRNRPQGG